MQATANPEVNECEASQSFPEARDRDPGCGATNERRSEQKVNALEQLRYE